MKYSLLLISILFISCENNKKVDHDKSQSSMKEFIVKKSINIKAQPSEVWEALTNPELTKEYFFNCKVFSDWKKGSKITFKGRIFLIKKIEMSGEILDIEKEKLLKYNLKNESSSGITTVTDELSYADGVTTLTITDDVGQGEGAEKRYERSQKGWDKVLKGLKKLVESK